MPPNKGFLRTPPTEGFSGEESRLDVMAGFSRRRGAASKIVAILTAGIGPSAFLFYRCGAAEAQAVRRLAKPIGKSDLYDKETLHEFKY